MVSTGDDLKEIYFGADGVAALAGSFPKLAVDCSSIGVAQSTEIQVRVEALGAGFLAAGEWKRQMRQSRIAQPGRLRGARGFR
jgi:3-hydroxyisobutyrate dehydrogenase-like beta-hydroxyacid dehydrogenase